MTMRLRLPHDDQRPSRPSTANPVEAFLAGDDQIASPSESLYRVDMPIDMPIDTRTTPAKGENNWAPECPAVSPVAAVHLVFVFAQDGRHQEARV